MTAAAVEPPREMSAVKGVTPEQWTKYCALAHERRWATIAEIASAIDGERPLALALVACDSVALRADMFLLLFCRCSELTPATMVPYSSGFPAGPFRCLRCRSRYDDVAHSVRFEILVNFHSGRPAP